ncbi:copper resistance protein B [Parasphingorhabdus sp.]|uniref:copper resistance protein B n=1 Tax=Parasphingorhabdus sp. TaxID=2709688 RepID=UPI002F92B83D
MKMMIALLLSSTAVPNVAFAQSHDGHNMPAMADPAEKPVADEADPHAGHNMDTAKPAQDDVPVNHDEMDHEGLPHEGADEAEASQDMQMDSMSDPQMDHSQMDHGKMNQQSEEADTNAGHDMPLDLPVNAPPPPEAFDGPTYAADQYVGAEEMAASRAGVARAVSGTPVFWFQGDRLEYRAREGKNGYLWDVQGYYGGDLEKFWFKSEGEGSFGEAIESAEVQALYSKAIAPFFDVQAGIRQDLTGPERTHAVVGIQGLAPYLFEVDAALFLSNKGDITARIEGELDQKITQRLILQPRAEVNLAAQDIPELGVGAGLDSLEVGLRLRYEFAREFAPYIGIEQEWKLGGSRDFARAAGEDPSVTNYVVGIRFWF